MQQILEHKKRTQMHWHADLFTEGKASSDVATILDAAEEAGLDAKQVEFMLKGDKYLQEVWTHTNTQSTSISFILFPSLPSMDLLVVRFASTESEAAT